MKRTLSIIMSAVLMTGVFTGCSLGNKADSGKKVTITFLNNKTDINDTTLRDFVDKFEKENPNIKVKCEAVGDYYSVAQTRASGGALPDVSYLMPTLTEKEWGDFYVPLDDLDISDFYFKDLYTYDGHLYAVPIQMNYSGIVYNKKTFAKAGIDTLPKTLDEFYAMCQKLKDAGIVPTTPIYKEKGVLGAYIENIAPCIDPDWYANISNGKDPFTKDSPVGQVLTILDTIHKKGYFEDELMSQTSESMKKDLATGKLGFMFSQSWLVPQVVKAGADSEDIGIFPFPFDNSGIYKTYLKPDMRMAVSKDSKHPEEAKKFIKWMLDTNYDEFLKVMDCSISVKKDASSYTMPQFEEFKSYNPEKIEFVKNNEKLSLIFNKARFSFDDMAHDVIDEKDVQKVLDKYNTIYNKAYDAVSK